MVKHDQWWYIKRLQKYYNEHFLQYDENVEWFGDSSPNKWKFIVLELNAVVTLTCNEDGSVMQQMKYV